MERKVRIYHAGGAVSGQGVVSQALLYAATLLHGQDILISNGTDRYSGSTFPRDIGVLWNPRENLGEANLVKIVSNASDLLAGRIPSPETLELDPLVEKKVSFELLSDMILAHRFLKKRGL